MILFKLYDDNTMKKEVTKSIKSSKIDQMRAVVSGNTATSGKIIVVQKGQKNQEIAAVVFSKEQAKLLMELAE